jgi:hemerythrin-like domain-containing protein
MLRFSKPEQADCQKDFVEYCLAWARLLDEHHRVEGEGIFPAVERIVGEKGVMGRETEEHSQYISVEFVFRSALLFPYSLYSGVV